MCFIDHFSALDDPRKDINIKYDFLDIVFLTVCAVVSGAEGWKDIKQFGDEKIEWLRQYRAFGHGIPVDDTIARLIRAIEPEKMNQAFINWVNEVRKEQGREQIAIDGKTLRHSFQGDHGSALHSITAWSKQQGLILAQMKSLGKKNENASVLVLLDTLNINGALISVDAMNTQKKIADKIIGRGADYVLCVKTITERYETKSLHTSRKSAATTRNSWLSLKKRMQDTVEQKSGVTGSYESMNG